MARTWILPSTEYSVYIQTANLRYRNAWKKILKCWKLKSCKLLVRSVFSVSIYQSYGTEKLKTPLLIIHFLNEVKFLNNA